MINKFVDSWKASKRKPRPEHKLINDMEELDAFIGLQIYRLSWICYPSLSEV